MFSNAATVPTQYNKMIKRPTMPCNHEQEAAALTVLQPLACHAEHLGAQTLRCRIQFPIAGKQLHDLQLPIAHGCEVVKNEEALPQRSVLQLQLLQLRCNLVGARGQLLRQLSLLVARRRRLIRSGPLLLASSLQLTRAARHACESQQFMTGPVQNAIS